MKLNKKQTELQLEQILVAAVKRALLIFCCMIFSRAWVLHILLKYPERTISNNDFP